MLSPFWRVVEGFASRFCFQSLATCVESRLLCTHVQAKEKINGVRCEQTGNANSMMLMKPPSGDDDDDDNAFPCSVPLSFFLRNKPRRRRPIEVESYERLHSGKSFYLPSSHKRARSKREKNAKERKRDSLSLFLSFLSMAATSEIKKSVFFFFFSFFLDLFSFFSFFVPYPNSRSPVH